MTLTPLEQQMLDEMLKSKFETIVPPFPGVFDEFKHLYKLTVKLGRLDLAKEFDSDFKLVYNINLKTLIK